MKKKRNCCNFHVLQTGWHFDGQNCQEKNKLKTREAVYRFKILSFHLQKFQIPTAAEAACPLPLRSNINSEEKKPAAEGACLHLVASAPLAGCSLLPPEYLD